MKNAAIIPDVLSATTDLMNLICKALPAHDSHDDVLKVLSRHQSTISKISKKANKIVEEMGIVEKVNDKFDEIKAWSSNNKEIALPVVAWSYFTQSILHCDEFNIVSNVVVIMPIVDMSFKEYLIRSH